MRDIPWNLVDDAIDAAGLYTRDEYTERGDSNVVNVRTNYSGRFMYGDRCFAIDFESHGAALSWMAAFAMRATEYESDFNDGELPLTAAPPLDVIEFAGETRMDNMGRGIVLYWPGYRLVDLPPELRDEDEVEELADA